jgi:hypothetical protein
MEENTAVPKDRKSRYTLDDDLGDFTRFDLPIQHWRRWQTCAAALRDYYQDLGWAEDPATGRMGTLAAREVNRMLFDYRPGPRSEGYRTRLREGEVDLMRIAAGEVLANWRKLAGHFDGAPPLRERVEAMAAALDVDPEQFRGDEDGDDSDED